MKERYNNSRTEVLKIMKEVDRESSYDSSVVSGVIWMALRDGYVVYRVGGEHVLLYVEQGIYKVDTEKTEAEIVQAILKASTTKELIDLLQ